jgi:hypothetical protein
MVRGKIVEEFESWPVTCASGMSKSANLNRRLKMRALKKVGIHTVVLVAMVLLPIAVARAAETDLKQPVFLLCPHSSKYSAWSLYLVVDPKDHSKVLSLGLEGLKNQNSKDSSYADVLVAQYDPKVAREFVAGLDAKDFSSGTLNVAVMDALHISLAPQPDGSLTLMISMRVSATGRFVIGGKKLSSQNIALVYDPVAKTWLAKVKTLSDFNGDRVALASGKTMTGLIFPLTGTGVYTIMGVMEGGDSTTLMDRSEVAIKD